MIRVSGMPLIVSQTVGSLSKETDIYMWKENDSPLRVRSFSTVLRFEREEILQKSLENLILKGGDVRYFLDH